MRENFKGLEADVYGVIEDLYLEKNPPRVIFLERKLSAFLKVINKNLDIIKFFYKKTKQKSSLQPSHTIEESTPFEMLLRLATTCRAINPITQFLKDFNFSAEDLLPIKQTIAEEIMIIDHNWNEEEKFLDLYEQLCRIYAEIICYEAKKEAPAPAAAELEAREEPQAIVPQFQLQSESSSSGPVSEASSTPKADGKVIKRKLDS